MPSRPWAGAVPGGDRPDLPPAGAWRPDVPVQGGGAGRFRLARTARRTRASFLLGRPYQGGSARAVGGTRGKAGEPSRLVAALPRRGRAPAPTPAGLEPRRQGERGRHLARPPRAPPHGRWRDDRRLRLGRRGRGRRLAGLGRTGGAPRAGGTRDGGAADELQLELLAGMGLGLPSRRRGQGGALLWLTCTSSIPDGLAAASATPSRSERGRGVVRASRGPGRPRTARPPPGSSLASPAGGAPLRARADPPTSRVGPAAGCGRGRA